MGINYLITYNLHRCCGNFWVSCLKPPNAFGSLLQWRRIQKQMPQIFKGNFWLNQSLPDAKTTCQNLSHLNFKLTVQIYYSTPLLQRSQKKGDPREIGEGASFVVHKYKKSNRCQIRNFLDIVPRRLNFVRFSKGEFGYTSFPLIIQKGLDVSSLAATMFQGIDLHTTIV